MVRNYRFRKLFAPTAGLQVAVVFALLGIISLTFGLGLSFKNLVLPFFAVIFEGAKSLAANLVAPDQVPVAVHWMGLLMLALGTYLTFRAFRSAFNHVVETLIPSLKSGKVDVYLRRQQLAQGPRIVAMGGGTGLSTLLRGLKQHSSNITAIVTVTDDGGSSGALIRDKGMIPPGDIRNCLVALADAERSMTDLFQHRFRDDSGTLSGHSMGNLLIAALVDQAKGDFEKAIEIASDVLAIRGRVVPSTLDHVGLRAELDDGSVICGETAIVAAGKRIRSLQIDPPNCMAYQAALDAIRDADLVCIGPGSVYTSVIPNLLIPGIVEALDQTKAIRVYVCNVMTQPGESDSFSASEHANAILAQIGHRVFDYVLINTATPSEAVRAKYQLVGQQLVEADDDRIRAMGLKVLKGSYLSESDVVRHDPLKVAARLVGLIG
jgi:uncharacterized cofD-like protein